MNEYLRNKPTMSEFTGIDMDKISTIKDGEDYNGRDVLVYNLKDVVKEIGIKRNNVESYLDSDDVKIFEIEGAQSKYLTEKGLFKILQDLDVDKSSGFRNFVSGEVLSKTYNYGIYADNHMKELFEMIEEDQTEQIVEAKLKGTEDESDYMQNLYKFLDATTSQIK